METWPLFVTPIGIMLVLTGVLYFVTLGRWTLPGKRGRGEDAGAARSMQTYVGTPMDCVQISSKCAYQKVRSRSVRALDIMVAHHIYPTSYRGHRLLRPWRIP